MNHKKILLLTCAGIISLITNSISSDMASSSQQTHLSKISTFNTYTTIIQGLNAEEASFQKLCDLYNPVRMMNDVYAELHKTQVLDRELLKNIFLKLVFAQRFHYVMSGDLISINTGSAEDSFKVILKLAKGKTSYARFVSSIKTDKPNYRDIKPLTQYLTCQAELESLDEHIKKAKETLLSTKELKSLQNGRFPLSAVNPIFMVNAARLGMSNALSAMEHFMRTKPFNELENPLRITAEGGNIGLMMVLGLHLLANKHTPEALEEAETLFRKAIDGGSIDTIPHLANLLTDKKTPEALEEAEELFQKAIDKGNTKAIDSLVLLLEQKQTPEALKKAEALFQKAIDKGSIKTLNKLALILEQKQTSGALKKAEALFQKAIDRGSIEALNNLALLLKKKKAPEALKKAERLFREAIDRGSIEASYNLADLLIDKKTPEALEEAEGLLREVIGMNNMNPHIIVATFNNLGYLLVQKKTLKALEEAAEFFQKAVDRGNIV